MQYAVTVPIIIVFCWPPLLSTPNMTLTHIPNQHDARSTLVHNSFALTVEPNYKAKNWIRS